MDTIRRADPRYRPSHPGAPHYLHTMRSTGDIKQDWENMHRRAQSSPPIDAWAELRGKRDGHSDVEMAPSPYHRNAAATFPSKWMDIEDDDFDSTGAIISEPHDPEAWRQLNQMQKQLIREERPSQPNDQAMFQMGSDNAPM